MSIKKYDDIRNILGQVSREVSKRYNQRPVYRGYFTSNVYLYKSNSKVHKKSKTKTEIKNNHINKKEKSTIISNTDNFNYEGIKDWRVNATKYEKNLGQTFVFECKANGKISDRLWGTDSYSTSSHICTAGVHAGRITAKDGGIVTIKILGKIKNSFGSERNRVRSTRAYNCFAFKFVDNPPNIKRKGDKGMEYQNEGGIDWGKNATEYERNLGQTFVFHCQPNGAISNHLWGTGNYSTNSSICTAGVHAGRITAKGGGILTIKILGKIKNSFGSKQNGVTSRRARNCFAFKFMK